MGLGMLVLLISCPETETIYITSSTNDNGGSGNGGSGNGGNGNGNNSCGTLSTGARAIFADAAGIPENLPVTPDIGQTAGDGGSIMQIEGTGGANGSPNYVTVQVTGSPRWAAIFRAICGSENAPHDVSGLAFQFSVRAASGHVGKIKAKLESVGNDCGRECDQAEPQGRVSEEVEKPFTANGQWQTITIPATEFIANPNTDDGGSVRGRNYNRDNGIVGFVIVLSDTDDNPDNGVGAQTVDIDEIRFVQQ